MAKEITIKIGLDSADAERKANEFGRKFKSALDPSQAAVTNLRSAVGGLTAAFAALGGLAVFKQIAEQAIQAAINLDKTKQTLIALTGSAEAANKKLAELRKLAAATPGVTATFATQLFTQLKAIGEITDTTINKVITSVGKLNAVFTIEGPTQFTSNLIQIFQQGFERADIKEAIGQVPIFEQILKQAFGTNNPDALRKR